MRRACRDAGTLAIAALCAACAAGSTAAPSGVAPARAAASRPGARATDDPPLGGWPILLAWRPSLGHAPPRYDVEVRIARIAGDLAGSGSGRATWPVGTRLVAQHRERATGRAGSTFVMDKVAPDRWSYFVMAEHDPRAGEAARLCAGCHEGAPVDSVYLVPRQSPTVGN